MSRTTNKWRGWVTLVVGGYLVSTPWVLGVPVDAPSSGNAWLAGISLVMVALWALLETRSRTNELVRVGLASWLFVSPFALGFAGSGIAYNAWVIGVLVITLTDILNPVFDLQDWLRPKRLGYRARAVSPESIVSYETIENDVGPERLSRQIVERSYRIHRTLQDRPSDVEVEVEMCALGYRACADDMITLSRLIDKELPEAGPSGD